MPEESSCEFLSMTENPITERKEVRVYNHVEPASASKIKNVPSKTMKLKNMFNSAVCLH